MSRGRPGVLVRLLTEVELSLMEELAKIEQASFGSGGMNQWFLAPFVRYGRVFAAFEGRSFAGSDAAANYGAGDDTAVPVGVAEYMKVLKAPYSQPGSCTRTGLDQWSPDLFLFGLSVSPAHRRKGIAGELLTRSIRHLRREGFRRLELTVDPENPAVSRLYSTDKGFFVIGQRKDEYGPGIHRLVLGLDLEEYRHGDEVNEISGI